MHNIIIHNNNKNTFLQRFEKHKGILIIFVVDRTASVHEIIIFIHSIIFRKTFQCTSWISLSNGFIIIIIIIRYL